MADVINFVLNNGLQIATVILAVLKLAQEVAKITPTQKDDNFIEKYFRKPLEWIGNVGLPNLVASTKKK